MWKSHHLEIIVRNPCDMTSTIQFHGSRCKTPQHYICLVDSGDHLIFRYPTWQMSAWPPFLAIQCIIPLHPAIGILNDCNSLSVWLDTSAFLFQKSIRKWWLFGGHHCFISIALYPCDHTHTHGRFPWFNLCHSGRSRGSPAAGEACGQVGPWLHPCPFWIWRNDGGVLRG